MIFHILLLSSPLLTSCFVYNRAEADRVLKDEKINLTDILIQLPPDDFNMEIGFQLTSVSAVDSAKQNMRLVGQLRVNWFDDYLNWEVGDSKVSADKYNTSIIQVDSSAIWFPNIAITNGLGQEKNWSQQIDNAQKVIITYNGKVLTSIIREFEVKCTFRVHKFPYDEQTCSILMTISKPPQQKFVSVKVINSTDDSDEFKDVFNIDGLDMHHSETSEWEIIDSSQKLSPYEKGTVYITYEYKVTLKRLPNYFNVYLVTPTFLLVSIKPLVFLAPLESKDKIPLGVNILLSFFVFLVILNRNLPRSDELPWLAYFILTSIVISATNLITAAFLTRLYYTSPWKQPHRFFTEYLVLKLAKFVKIKLPSGSTYEDVSLLNQWKVAAMALERVISTFLIIITLLCALTFIILIFSP